MTQAIPVREIQAAGGLEKWKANNASMPPVKPCLKPESKPSSHRSTPAARGRKPQNRLVGYDADRMNKLEAKYAAHLETQRRVGKIILWRYESVKFRLADRTWYTPDFYIMRPDGSIEIHETKGHWEDDARVKIKATAEQFPELCFVAVQWGRGEWQFERFRAGGMQ